MSRKEILVIGVGSLIYFVALFVSLSFFFSLFLFIVSYILISRDILFRAAKNILHGKVFDENFLLTVATLGAFAIQKFPEAVAVMLFFKVGEAFEEFALNRSRKSITSLLEIRPDYANLKTDGETKKVSPYEVKPGDVIVVKPGEKIPLDGVVLEGSSTVDTSTLTGEPVPRSVREGDEIFSGMVNKSGLLTVKVSREFGESTVSKILKLVENASSRKAPTEKFITKFARYYTPSVVFAAVLLATTPVILYNIPHFTQYFHHEETFSEWIYKALIFLVISCPCALVISIPLGFFGGIGAASRRGILVKGSNYLEGLNNLETVIWDKTGTLTKGVFKLTEIVPLNGFSKKEVLETAAAAEVHSNHPIAQSVLNALDYLNNSELEKLVKDYQEIPGYGVKAVVGNKTVFIGNDKLLHRENVEHDTCDVQGTVIHVVIDSVYAGYLVISDEIKEDAKEAVERLRALGVKRQVMFTGDSETGASYVSSRLGLDGYFASLLPHQKVEKLEELLKEKNGLVAFVGDGINDAPVLVRSDIGIAMGALGSDAAIEAADVVLMTDEPSKLPEALMVAKRTRRIVWENIGFALSVKGMFLALGALGMATMWEAVFADVGVALIAILNSTRVLSFKK